MSNSILSLLVPNVTADKGDKPAGPLAAQPLGSLADIGASFKEVLASMDRFGAQPRTLAQIRQDLQGLAVDAQQKFLKDLQDGLADGNPFAGLAMPGILPQVAQTKYHEIAAVVEAIPAATALPEGLPVTPLPLDALTQTPPIMPSAPSEPEMAITAPAPMVIDTALVTAQQTALPDPLSDEEESASPADVLLPDITAPDTAAPDAPLDAAPVNETRVTASTPVPLDTIPEINASQLAPLTERGSVVAVQAVDQVMTSTVTAQNLAATTLIEVASEGETDAAADDDFLPALAEAVETTEPATVKAAGKERAEPLHLRGERKAETPETAVADADTNPKDKATRAEAAAFALPQGTPNHTATAPAGLERAEPVVRALEVDAPGIAVATPHGRSFDASLAANASLITVQVRPNQPLGNQLRVHIKQVVADGVDEINIRLMPESLGRIDVKIDLNADGSAQVRVMADKAETFDLLQRDARGLERALAEAGIKADSGSLQFQLRDGGNGNAQAQQGFGDRRGYGQRDSSGEAPRDARRGTGDDIMEMEDTSGLMRLVATTGLNIRV
jgi:hypothetical protein